MSLQCGSVSRNQSSSAPALQAAQALLPPTVSTSNGAENPTPTMSSFPRGAESKGTRPHRAWHCPSLPLGSLGTGLGSCATSLQAGAGGRARAPTARGCHLLALRPWPWRLPGWMEHPAGLPGDVPGAPIPSSTPRASPQAPGSPLPPLARGRGWVRAGTDLDGDGERLDAPQRALVEGVEDVVPHVGGLQDVPALPAGHEQGLVHLHGLVWGAQGGGEWGVLGPFPFSWGLCALQDAL